jgi:hypothetical protein
MGLTVYYDWKTKTDLLSARRLIAKCCTVAFNTTELTLEHGELEKLVAVFA